VRFLLRPNWQGCAKRARVFRWSASAAASFSRLEKFSALTFGVKASRSSLSGGILLLLLALIASNAYGRVGYQLTIDGKTRVWHFRIKTGDTVTWSGDRDANGYGTGPGTLTVYPMVRNFVAGPKVLSDKKGDREANRYTGTMVAGKFEGLVTMDTKGKLFHTQFADGDLAAPWLDGPAPSPEPAVKAPSPSATPLEPPKAKAVESPRVEASPRPTEPERTPAKTAATPRLPASTPAPSLLSLGQMPMSSLALRSTPPPRPTATATAIVRATPEPATPPPSPTSKKEDDAKIVAALDTQYRDAVKANDAPVIGRILADDFVLVNGRARVATKADLIKAAQEKSVIYENQEEREGSQTVRVYGDTAVVTAVLYIKGTDAGKPLEYQLCLSDVYLRTPAGWRDVFSQASLPPPNAAAK
jgi:ketosteroid isomerase-like protein